MERMMVKRNTYYDKLKGVAIILVVIGHSIQRTYCSNFDSNIVFRLIYSFHMPLFMFINGLVSWREDENYDLQWLFRRVQSLVIPFAAWIVPNIAIGGNWKNLFGVLRNIVESPDYANWFLWVLFLNCCLLFVVYKLRCYLPHIFWSYRTEVAMIMVFLTIRFVGRGITVFGINFVRWYSLFYFAGHIVAKNKRTLKRVWLLIGIFCTFLWVLLVPYWRRTENPTFAENWGKSMLVSISVMLYKYFIGFAGTAMIMFFVYLIRKYKLTELLAYIGRRTIEIYVLHTFFFGFTLNGKVEECTMNMIVALSLSILISEAFERNMMRRVLFGKK